MADEQNTNAQDDRPQGGASQPAPGNGNQQKKPQQPQQPTAHGQQSAPDEAEEQTGWDADGNPHFGQMRNEYGANYNPYRFGGPEPTNQNGNRRRRQNGQNQNTGNDAWRQNNPGWNGSGQNQNGNPSNYGQNSAGGYGQNGYGQNGNGYGPNNGWGSNPSGPYGASNGQNYGPNGYGQNGYGPNAYGPGRQGSYGAPNGWNGQQGPNQPPMGMNPNMYGTPYGDFGPYFQPINPDDPNQNPLYGHWDWTAIMAFVFSFFGWFSFFSLPLGFIAYRRDKIYHMKGKGLAIAAIVISILNILAMFALLLDPSLLHSSLGALSGLGSGSGQSTSSMIQTLFMLR